MTMRVLQVRNKIPAVLASLILCCFTTPSRAVNPFARPMEMRYFMLLQGPNSKAAVGARLEIGLYPKKTDTQFIARQLQSLPAVKRYQYPEWLVVRELHLRRDGDLKKLLKLYKPGPSRKMARSLYSDMAYTMRFAKRISAERLCFKARFGPMSMITVETATPQYKFTLPWGFYFERSSGPDWRFIKRPPGTMLFSAIAGMYPYWLPANKQIGFRPTKNYFQIVRHYSKKFPKPDAAVYIRKIRTFPPAIVKTVRNILHVYQTGSDKDIVALWRPKDRKVWARRLAAHSDTSSDMRDPFKDKRGFRAFPSILGGDVVFVLLQPMSGGSIVKLRLAKINGKWYQSRLSDANTPVDWLPKYPGYEAYVLAHRKVSVLIKSGER